MYHVSIDERMINVHYYYYKAIFCSMNLQSSTLLTPCHIFSVPQPLVPFSLFPTSGHQISFRITVTFSCYNLLLTRNFRRNSKHTLSSNSAVNPLNYLPHIFAALFHSDKKWYQRHFQNFTIIPPPPSMQRDCQLISFFFLVCWTRLLFSELSAVMEATY